MSGLRRLLAAVRAPPARPPAGHPAAPYVRAAMRTVGIGPMAAPAAPAVGVPYTGTGTVRLDAAGAGTASVFCPGMDWVIDTRSVRIAGAGASGATAQEFLNGVGDFRYLQGTYDAASDSSGRRQLLQPGDVIYVVWAGGPANAVAVFRAAGLVYPVGQGRAHL